LTPPQPAAVAGEGGPGARPGVVVAMARELRVLERAWALRPGCAHLVALSGVGPARARDSAMSLLERGAPALASIGLAGALAPRLRCGDLLVPQEIMDEQGQVYAADPRWRDLLLASLSGRCRVEQDAVVSVARVAGSPAGKVRLAACTGAGAVDMEAAAVAQACRRWRRPVIAIKVIVDEREHRLPPALGQVLDGFGRARAGPLLLALLRAPGLARDLVRLARLCARAEARLAEVMQAVGPGLCLPHRAPGSPGGGKAGLSCRGAAGLRGDHGNGF
jgi:hypothetical protein